MLPIHPAAVAAAGVDEAVLPMAHTVPEEVEAAATASAETAGTADILFSSPNPQRRKKAVLQPAAVAAVITDHPKQARHPAETVL